MVELLSLAPALWVLGDFVWNGRAVAFDRFVDETTKKATTRK